VLRFPLPMIPLTVSNSSSFIIIRRWYNRPIGGLSNSGLVFGPSQRKNKFIFPPKYQNCGSSAFLITFLRYEGKLLNTANLGFICHNSGMEYRKLMILVEKYSVCARAFVCLRVLACVNYIFPKVCQRHVSIL
jgi:hypothetical protein